MRDGQTQGNRLEEIDGVIEFVDAELSGDAEYDAMGDTAMGRVTKLLKELESILTSKDNGKKTRENKAKKLDKFIQLLESILAAMPCKKQPAG